MDDGDVQEDWDDVCSRLVEVAHSLGVQLEGLVGVTVSGGCGERGGKERGKEREKERR